MARDDFDFQDYDDEEFDKVVRAETDLARRVGARWRANYLHTISERVDEENNYER